MSPTANASSTSAVTTASFFHGPFFVVAVVAGDKFGCISRVFGQVPLRGGADAD